MMTPKQLRHQLTAEQLYLSNLPQHRKHRVNRRRLARMDRRQIRYWRSVRDRQQLWNVPSKSPLRYWVRGLQEPAFAKRMEARFDELFLAAFPGGVVPEGSMIKVRISERTVTP